MSAPTTPRVTTRTGIVIGGAYVATPPAPGIHAETIQRALLAPPQVIGAGGAMLAPIKSAIDRATERAHERATHEARARYNAFFASHGRRHSADLNPADEIEEKRPGVRRPPLLWHLWSML